MTQLAGMVEAVDPLANTAPDRLGARAGRQAGGLTVPKPRRSLTASLLWLTLALVLLTEAAVFVPYIVRERRTWLYAEATKAHMAGLALSAAQGGAINGTTRMDLLRLARAEVIEVIEPGRDPMVLRSDHAAAPVATFDLRREDALDSLQRSFAALFDGEDRPILLIAVSPLRPDVEVRVVFHEAALSRALGNAARNYAPPALLVAIATGALLYVLLLVVLVRPMQRIIESIAAFRMDPEHSRMLDPARVAMLPNTEIALAGRELAALQQELRATLARNERLTQIGGSMAKISHDVRNLLSPAMLAAERLHEHPDPLARRYGDMVARAVERVMEVIGRMLDFARDGQAPSSLAVVKLGPLVNEAFDGSAERGCTLVNMIDENAVVAADSPQLFRVLSNLARNATEAGARTVTVRPVAARPGSIAWEFADDGPGLPEQVRASLFRAFAGSSKPGGSGLGLAIARDLMRAQGGDISLVRTGPEGTVFRLVLSAPQEET